MESIVNKACELLERREAFVIATIINQQGSAPRTAGTQMLITRDQEIFGTIGGGLLEHQTIQAAARIHRGAPSRILTFDLSSRDAAESDMICGGYVEVLLDHVRPGEGNRAVLAAWQQARAAGEKACFVTIVPNGDREFEHTEHCLVGADGRLHGRCHLSTSARKTLAAAANEATHQVVLTLEGFRVVADPAGAAHRLYIFGAGHVARPTAHLAALVGFEVVVIDDRADFADTARFPDAACVRTIEDFDTALADLPVSTGSFIVIVTRGHLHDRTVLAQALKTQAAYIGMIGSRRKRDSIYASLLQDGYTPDDLQRVHCPIGLNINAQTPEEIAVSIAAELVAARADPSRSKARLQQVGAGS